MNGPLTTSQMPKKPLSIHSDTPSYNRCIVAKINREKDIVEVSIDGKSIYLDDDNTRHLAFHLLELIK